MPSLFSGTIYCFDTNALIDLFRRKYPPDIFETIWNNIETEIVNGSMVIPREVYRELAKNDDELFRWIKAHAAVVRPPDSNQAADVATILAKFPDLIDPTKTTPDADPFVIALAMAEGGVVVTSENLAGPGGRPKIPNACDHFDVKWLNLLDYFREKQWKH